MIKKFVLLICLLISFMLKTSNAQIHNIHTTEGVDCTLCHECDNPSKDNPCLKPCPRPFREQEKGKKLSPDKSPDYIILDELEDLYEPVRFSHKIHADMAYMLGGCVSCHHFTPTNQSHPPCKECHDPEVLHENIKQPGLKGAYHRQCIGCHSEWSGETDCDICHAMKAKKEAMGENYVEHHYKPCDEPVQKVYQTKFEKAEFVTFWHANHSRFYGLECNDCHRQDPCVTCHYQKERPVSVVKASADAMHHKCSACHNINSSTGCYKCHSKTEQKHFDHKRATGWALGSYHKNMKCNRCHPESNKMVKPSPMCNNCHEKWDSENFDHAITGLKLDEIHEGADCSDCHPDRQFDKKPDCSGCHDGDMTYPNDLPGTLTN
ncbi:hypothetical protein GF337_07820 [candidate division KSB1 bacterium]|nr:hypothetical protein [candidate division KSB1 bacterium]